jgi:hypothetical protein
MVSGRWSVVSGEAPPITDHHPRTTAYRLPPTDQLPITYHPLPTTECLSGPNAGRIGALVEDFEQAIAVVAGIEWIEFGEVPWLVRFITGKDGEVGKRVCFITQCIK